jgi:hypothetical protein
VGDRRAAHVDYWWIQTAQAYAVRDKETPPSLACQPEPGSHVPLRYVLNAGYHHLANWILKGQAPPQCRPIVMTSITPAVIARDAERPVLWRHPTSRVSSTNATNRGDQWA